MRVRWPPTGELPVESGDVVVPRARSLAGQRGAFRRRLALRPRSAFPPPLQSGSLGILASAVVRVPAWAGVAVQRGSGLSDPRCAPPAANPVGSP